MSYILDALKRADAERERGHVPGLHTRTTRELDTPAATADGFGQRKRLMALAALLSLGAVLWWWLRAAPPAPAAPIVSAAAPTVPTPVAPASPAPPSSPIQPPEPADSSDLTSGAAPPVLPILAPPLPQPPASVALATPKAAASPAAATAVGAQRAPSQPNNATAKQESTNASAPAGATAGAATTPVTNFAELSTDARARLPAVNVSGSTYSKNPALRMLIANGKVVQEGGEIAPGLTLETIEQRSAVLNHQGLRYRIGY
jgi:general secretion pathway protein B